jgi:hypothetical protein
MASKKAIFKKSVVGEGVAAVLTWTALDGSGSVTFDIGKSPAVTQANLVVHGAGAKIGDAAAMQEATVAEKLASMQKVIDALNAGEWRGERESGDALLLEAICEFNPKKTREQHAESLKALASAEKLQLRTIPQIKKIYDRLLADSAKKSTVKVDDLLAKFATAA